MTKPRLPQDITVKAYYAILISGDNSPVREGARKDRGKCMKTPNHQQNYRKNQAHKGLVRYELQIPKAVKEKIEQLVSAIADEYDKPYDSRRRIAMARTQLFTELTADIQHEFTQLNAQITALQDELAVVAPSFFINKQSQERPLPNAIAELPDEPTALKQLIAKFYSQLKTAEKTLKDQQTKADTYYNLYDTLTDENDRLRKLTKDYDEFPLTFDD